MKNLLSKLFFLALLLHNHRRSKMRLTFCDFCGTETSLPYVRRNRTYCNRTHADNDEILDELTPHVMAILRREPSYHGYSPRKRRM